MRFTSTLTTLTLLTLSLSAGAKGNKNLADQGGASWFDKTKATYTSEYKAAAQSASSTDFATANRELEALNLEIVSLKSKVDPETTKLRSGIDPQLAGHISGFQTKDKNGKDIPDVKRNQEYLANKSKLDQLETRAKKLNLDAEEKVKELTGYIKTRDAKLISELKNLPSADGKGEISGDVLKDFAALTLARFELSDLKSDWQTFANKTGNAQAALAVVSAKLDNSIIGTYVKQSVLNGPEFCAAVKKATGTGPNACSAATPAPAAPALAPVVNETPKATAPQGSGHCTAEGGC